MSQPPLITVLTPLYNYEKYIERAILSVLNQTYPHIEMIVIDDGSTDSGPDIVKRYADQGVRLIQQKRNAFGIARALNTGLDAAKGEYIAWLSADDYYLPEKLEISMNALLPLKNNPKWVGIYTDIYLETHDKTVFEDHFSLFDHQNPELKTQFHQKGSARFRAKLPIHDPEQFLWNCLSGVQLNGCTLLCLKSALKEVGGFYETWSLAQDHEMWIRLALNGYQFHYVDEPLTVSDFHPVNHARNALDVPAELQLVSRELHLKLDKNYVFAHAKYPKDEAHYHLFFARFFRPHQMIDASKWHYEKILELGIQLPPEDQEIYRSLNQWLPAPPQSKPHVKGFVIGLSQAKITWRLRDILTHYLKAFPSEPRPPLWVYLFGNPTPLKEMIEIELERIHDFLDRPLRHNESGIHFIENTPLESCFEYASHYIPIGTADHLEHQLLYLYTCAGQVVYCAEDWNLKLAMH